MFKIEDLPKKYNDRAIYFLTLANNHLFQHTGKLHQKITLLVIRIAGMSELTAEGYDIAINWLIDVMLFETRELKEVPGVL